MQLKIVLKEETPSRTSDRQSPNFVQSDSRRLNRPSQKPTGVVLDFKARPPSPKSAGFSGKLIVQVKPAAAKEPDKKDNQDHETDNADTASGSVPERKSYYFCAGKAKTTISIVILGCLLLYSSR